MSASLINNVERHNVYKFRDIRPKLNDDNWIFWRRELLVIARDRGLYRIIIGDEVKPTAAESDVTQSQITASGSINPHVVLRAWTERNDTAYNQILLTISKELQSLLDDTDEAAAAWKILCDKFNYTSTDPSKISLVRAKYDNYHMTDGQTVTSYISDLKKLRDQLKKMGDPVSDITHTSTILRNLPESWQPIASMVHIITSDPEIVETKLEAHEASLLAFQMNNRSNTALAAQQTRGYPGNCYNCGIHGHTAAKCYSPGGGWSGHNQARGSNYTAKLACRGNL